MSTLKVAVGSRNEAKIRGVVEGYRFFGIDVEVRSFDLSTIRQPRSLAETIGGALSRAMRALEIAADCDHGVGVESGLTLLPLVSKIVVVTAVVIVDRGGTTSVGLSPAFELPLKLANKLYSEDVELERAIEEVCGVKDVGESVGLIGYLTQSLYTRRELVRQATIMALTPRLCKRRDLYGYK